MAKKKTTKSKEKIEEKVETTNIILDTNLDDLKLNDVELDESETVVEEPVVEESDTETVSEIGKIDVDEISKDLDEFKEELFNEEKVEVKNKVPRKHNYLFGFMWNGQEYD